MVGDLNFGLGNDFGLVTISGPIFPFAVNTQASTVSTKSEDSSDERKSFILESELSVEDFLSSLHVLISKPWETTDEGLSWSEEYGMS